MALITILTTHKTERLNYTLNEILGRRLGVNYVVTTNIDEFNNTTGCRINYTNNTLSNCLHIVPVQLLFEEDIKNQPINIEKNKDWNTIFWPSLNQTIPFDIFAASFYLISRYEEYTATEFDIHQRFDAASSMAFKYDFLNLPLIEVWCDQLKKVLLTVDKSLHFKQHKFTPITTIDVDFAYLYNGINLKRWLGKLAKSMLKFDVKNVITQIKSTLNPNHDPYNTYDFINKTVKGKLGYFFLMSNAGGHDKNIAVNGPTFKNLVNHLKSKSSFIGLHPSYLSNQNNTVLATEKALLENLTAGKIEHSRQHFLKLHLPHTYQNLIAQHIFADYTMLYANKVGFRASTCMPFLFFDLTQNKTSNLTCYPTCFMDTTITSYVGLNNQETAQILSDLLEVTKLHNGYFITLWHNNTFVLPHFKTIFSNLFKQQQFD